MQIYYTAHKDRPNFLEIIKSWGSTDVSKAQNVWQSELDSCDFQAGIDFEYISREVACRDFNFRIMKL